MWAAAASDGRGHEFERRYLPEEKLIALKECWWLNPNLSHTAVRPGSGTAWPMLGLRPCFLSCEPIGQVVSVAKWYVKKILNLKLPFLAE